MAGALAGCAGLLLAHVLAPYDRLRSLYDALAPDGEAAFFSQALHQSLGTRLLAPAGALALLSLLLWAKRAAIDQYLRIQLHSDVREFWRLLSESFRHSFADSLWITGGFILVFAVALFLRLAFLGQPLRNDEATTFLYFAQQPWYRAISTTYEATNHPLNTLLMHISWRFLGDSLPALRLPVLIAGLLLVPLVHWFATAAFGRLAGPIAAAITAVTWLAVQYSVQARGYMLGTVLALALFGLAIGIARTNNRIAWLAFAVLAATTVFAVPSMIFGVLSATLWLGCLIVARQGAGAALIWLPRATLFAGLAAAGAALWYAPMWMLHGAQPLFGYLRDDQRPFHHILSGLGSQLPAVWEEWMVDTPLLIQLLLIAALLTGVTVRQRARYLVFALLFPVALGILAMRSFPPARVWAYAIPLMAALAGAGIAHLLTNLLTRRAEEIAAAVGAAGYAGIVATFLVGSQSLAVEGPGNVAERIDGRVFGGAELAAVLAPRLGIGDRIYTEFHNFSLEYYLNRDGVCADSFVDQAIEPARIRTGGTAYIRTCSLIENRTCRIVLRGAAEGGPCQSHSDTSYLVTRRDDDQASMLFEAWSGSTPPGVGASIAKIADIGPWKIFERRLASGSR